MMVKIEGVLDAAGVRRVREIIDAGPWVDGNETSGHQSRLTTRNRQLKQHCEEAAQAGRLVLDALGQAPEFVAAALPLKVFPPLFNRYAGGEAFGAHVDNSIRTLAGSDFRIRSDLSCTLFLEPPEVYEGGELVVEDLFGEHRVKLAAGDMVLYPSSSLHQVTPVTRGQRMAAILWLQSAVADAQARSMLFDLDQSIQSLSADRAKDDPDIDRLIHVYHNLLRRWATV